MARRLILSLFATCLTPCLLSAVEYEGTFEGKADGSVSSRAPGLLSLSFNFKAQFYLSHMMNDPLQNLKFVWHFDDRDGFGGSTIHNPLAAALLDNSARAGSIPARDIEPSVRAKIQLYDVIVRIEGKAVDSGQRLYIDFDSGVPGAEKEQNFNVTGSPKWSELFYETPFDPYSSFKYGDGRKRDYISEAAAKNVMRTGFKPTDATVIKARWNLNAFRSWYSQNYGTERREALGKAAWSLKSATEAIQDTGASVSKGAPTQAPEGRDALHWRLHGMTSQATEDALAHKPGALDPLEKIVTKLRGGIPPQFRIPEREKAYQEALKSIGDSLDAELKEIAARYPASNPEYAAWVQAKNKELKSRPQPDIEITDPANNLTVAARYLWVVGRSFVQGHTHVIVSVNGTKTQAPLKDGLFKTNVPLRDGENRIEVYGSLGTGAPAIRIVNCSPQPMKPFKSGIYLTAPPPPKRK